ncbi:diguanylate cyclase [Catenovulum agarivorans DS-2]|uniref:diguanylate cyclase n=1 Tax=Catenovulum agarivorans DS-2 TaxID=1328313 RepID=W7QRI6_9ALTE|nr:GGDEF domain-containing protein [Catenovulum agarivorans]EWH11577.1 diguanylate cyclase [Catenovulum agarivorans DS-2]
MVIKALFIPVALVVLSYLAHVEYLFQFGAWNRALEWLPQVSLLLAIGLAAQYNQIRVIIACLLGLAMLPELDYWLAHVPVEGQLLKVTKLLTISTAVILALCLPNKSLRHWLGWLIMLVGISPLVINYFGWQVFPSQLVKLLSFLVEARLPEPFFSYPVLAVCLLVILLSLLACWRYNQAQEGVFISLLCAGWLSSQLVGNQQLVALCFLSVAICAIIFVAQYAYRLAYYDELTGLPSRRALNQYASSLGRNYIVVMSDVDHFKKFNDTYGHDVGDQVLKLVASRLNQVGQGGRVFRYGGEEFTLVFKGHKQTKVVAELERLRQSIAEYDMVVRDKTRASQSKKNRKTSAQSSKQVVNVTISLGYCVSNKSYGSFDACLKIADEALYRAKKAGRNCVSD